MTFRKLVANSFAALLGLAVVSVVDGSVAEVCLDSAKSNHARFEGTWTPREMRLEKARRELELLNRAERRHALAEGAPVRAEVAD